MLLILNNLFHNISNTQADLKGAEELRQKYDSV
jgi:hypothetical protein